MRPTLRAREPIDQLRLLDIEEFPVWEYRTDEEGAPDRDEVWVRPAVTSLVPADAFSLSVAAKCRTASGAELSGIAGVTSSTFGGLEILHGAVITEDDYVFIPWPGSSDARSSCQAAAQELGIPESDLFPLRYELVVPVHGIQGIVRGEYAYGDA